MNSFGNIFKVQIFGESHGASVGVLVDGVKAGLEISEKDFLPDLERRRSGAKGTTPRKESDLPRLMSGVFNGRTTGAPVLIQFANEDIRSKDYDELIDHPRPGHADFVAMKKFGGFADPRGGGHFSGRLTAGLVAAGVIAKKFLGEICISAKLTEVNGSKDIDSEISKAIQDKDSVGGIVECIVENLPAGIGEPFFGSVESVISQIVFAIPAIKGIEFGAGFKAAEMRGSEHNDPILSSSGKTASNHSGGINGGISNGNNIVFRVAVKPTSSIGVAQKTINLKSGEVEELKVEGRHDACIALRVPVVVEAAAAIALYDLLLTAKAIEVFNKQV